MMREGRFCMKIPGLGMIGTSNSKGESAVGIFGSREEYVPPHPRKEPRLEGPLAPERVSEVFGGSVDLGRRSFLLGNDPNKKVELCYVMGQLRVERANDYVLRPLCENPALAAPISLEGAYELLRGGGVYSLIVQERTTLDQVVSTRAVPQTHEEIYQFAKKRSAFNHPAVMYRKSKVLEFGGYSDLRRNQDVDLFGRMLFGGCKAENIGESLLYFRSNDDLAKRRKSWENTKSYIDTIKRFWKMGYASFTDYVIVATAQTVMFLLPVKLQHWVYKTFLRK